MVERFEDDSPLKLAVERHSEVMTHHERDEHGARRLDVKRHVERDADGNCRDTSSFDGALHERDALVADRSSGREQHCVRAVGFDRPGDLFGQRRL